MRTLEELGYERIREDEDLIVYELKDIREIHILIDKRTKLALRGCDIDGDCLATWTDVDELKSVLAILEGKK